MSDSLSTRALWLPTVAEYPDVTRQFRQWGQKVKCGKKDRVYGLHEADQLVAAARVLEPAADQFLLRSLTVNPEYRRRGLARDLMQRILCQAREPTLYCYALDYLQDFYLSLDFNECDVAAVPQAIAEPYQRYRERGKSFVLMGWQAESLSKEPLSV
ncbi:GNAT family N-acetyltransferase [Gilvimarinus polysaccharolyticus]|uniref:GNAT family N-acetyltransferase n=1 Tax=Gilvimarinus polysaccharolyticus TaxID=863921 RepID=UPI000673570B|nr:GNAT family N-acetyltransferase [Gilvimarinus polysaccharolyticus]